MEGVETAEVLAVVTVIEDAVCGIIEVLVMFVFEDKIV